MDIFDDESSESEFADPNSLSMVLCRPLSVRGARNSVKKVPTLMIDLENLFSSTFYSGAVVSTSKAVSTEDATSTSVVLETLKELNKENEEARGIFQ